MLLRKSGAHLHSDERPAAELLARRRPGVWGLAGIDSKREMDEDDQSAGRSRTLLAGSAP
jgi:lysophospholipase